MAFNTYLLCTSFWYMFALVYVEIKPRTKRGCKLDQNKQSIIDHAESQYVVHNNERRDILSYYKGEYWTYFVQEILEVSWWKQGTKHRNTAWQNRADTIHISGMQEWILLDIYIIENVNEYFCLIWKFCKANNAYKANWMLLLKIKNMMVVPKNFKDLTKRNSNICSTRNAIFACSHANKWHFNVL